MFGFGKYSAHILTPPPMSRKPLTEGKTKLQPKEYKYDLPSSAPPPPPKVMGEWQTNNKNKQIVMPAKPKISKSELSIGQILQEDAVSYCEREYPEMMDEFKVIQKEMYETFCKKQRNYGPSNISVGTSLQTKEDVKLSLTGLWFRINDKVQRLKQLVVLGQPDEVGEPIQDTYQDLSVYGIIAQLVQRGKWAK